MTESGHITIDFRLAKDLIDTKHNLIIKEINNILSKWDQDSIEEFIDKAKSGELDNAEHDAILIGNYVDELKELENLLK